MEKILPYQIEHIQLKDYQGPHSLQKKNATQYYFVFWWDEIPLGHWFAKVVHSVQVTENILKAITPTVIKYTRNQKLLHDLKTALGKNNLHGFNYAMERAFRHRITDCLPAYVDISVIVCTSNRPANLKKCLASLISQQCLPKEIIVIDSAPADSCIQNLVKQFKGIKYHREYRQGLTIARNTGAKRASYPILAYTGDNVNVNKLWCYRVWEAFTDPHVHAMTGLVLPSSLQTESQQIFERHWGLNKGYHDIIFNSDFIFGKSPPAPKVWDIGAGANMAFRLDTLKALNYFDERLGTGAVGYGGDSEMWYRILANNFNIHYNPRAVVHHEHCKELAALHQTAFHYMRNHATALLIQHSHNPDLGFKRYVYNELPRYYIKLLYSGFPHSQARYNILSKEINGLISGIRFFHRSKKQAMQRYF